MQQELTDSRIRLEESNSSLSAVERENNQNRRKLVHLRKALRHNVTDGNASFVQALNEDSPNVAFTPPKLSGTPATPRRGLPRAGNEENCEASPVTSSNQSPDLFDPSDDDMESPHPSKLYPGQPSPKLKFIKVPTASEKVQAAKKAKLDSASNVDPPVPVLNILKRKLTGQSNSRTHVPSVSRVGYDGFGGTTTFVQPVGPPKSSFMMKDSQKKKLVKNKNICRPADQPKLSAAFSVSQKKPLSNDGMDRKGLLSLKTKSKPLSSVPSSSSSSLSRPTLTADDSLGTIDLT